MFISSLNLKNFRNYENLSLDFDSDKTLIIGKNAQGKTNILDSIFYLSSLKSLNAKTDSELIRWGENYAGISAIIKNSDIETKLDVSLSTEKKKVIKVNDIKKNNSIDFISKFSTVSFTVSDLLLLRGTPEDRRDWLDIAISQIYPAFDERLSKYNKIKTQKNNYLRTLKSGLANDKELLKVWNTQLLTCGANIIYLRIKFLKELQKIAQVKHSQISRDEVLHVSYDSSVVSFESCKGEELPSVEYIAEEFSKRLAEKEDEELIRCQSVVGPHRDDVSYFINDNDAKKYASQGQQRTIVLALKLAELEMIESKLDTTPVLLLDDVLAELDDIRQNYLLSSIKPHTQTIITSVDTLHFRNEYLRDVAIYRIAENQASRI